jgi:hypothetical protein
LLTYFCRCHLSEGDLQNLSNPTTFEMRGPGAAAQEDTLRKERSEKTGKLLRIGAIVAGTSSNSGFAADTNPRRRGTACRSERLCRLNQAWA